MDTLLSLTVEDLKQLNIPIGIIKKIELHLKSGVRPEDILEI